ncbi:MAG: hypothetical protein N2248_00340 [candidate division WOR-3 bacterium]|nr:hypothetical protein [candidate division WOR-3 bacterium]
MSNDALKDQILHIIKTRGPITAQQIADLIPILSLDPERIVRKKIRDLIMTDKQPIASSISPPYGYFLITHAPAEYVEQYRHQLRSRIEAIAQRLAVFNTAVSQQIQQLLFNEFDEKKPRRHYAQKNQTQ